MVVSYVGTLLLSLVVINIIVHTMSAKWFLVKRQELLMSCAKNLQYIAVRDGLDNIESIKNEIEKASCSSGAGVIIADNDRNVIESSGIETEWENIKTSYAVDEAYNGADSSGEYKDDGRIKFIYVAVPVIRNGDVAGIVLMSCMMDDVYSVADNISKNLALVSLAAMLLPGAAAYVMSDRITRPINEITKAIESMDEGNLRQHVTVTGRDEISRLCNVFNQMSDKVAEINDQRRTLVADAAHELKSPLAGIKVLVQALMSGVSEDKKVSYEFLNDIDKEADRLSKTVTSLLVLTKLEGEYGIKSEMFDLGLLCTEAAGKLKFMAEQKKLNLKVDIVSVFIEADREQILRVVYNILENAMKYTLEGTSVHLWMEEGEMAMVHVSDQGPGIPEDEIPNIFKRFYRLDKARNGKAGGSGLGLAIAMEIVKRHGGNIKVDSVVDEGTTFTVCLPYRHEKKDNKTENERNPDLRRPGFSIYKAVLECLIFI